MKRVILLFISMLLLCNVSYAKEYSGPFGLIMNDSIEKVEKTMDSQKDSHYLAKTENKYNNNKTTITSIGYIGKYIEEKAFINYYFINNRLYDVQILIPKSDESILNLYKNLQNMIITKYGNFEFHSGDGYSQSTNWNGYSVNLFLMNNPLYGNDSVNNAQGRFIYESPYSILIDYNDPIQKIVAKTIIKMEQSKDI